MFRYLGPGLLVTVGFIDPGNWASNVAAGAGYGYALLWMVTLSTIMLILLQHNAAHLGIATGLCMSEAASTHLPTPVSRLLLASALGAAVSTALAEILGGAIALKMLFQLPIKVGVFVIVGVVAMLLFTNSYRRLEKFIIGFVSIIGLSFLIELFLIDISWKEALVGWVRPQFPAGSLPVLISVLGAVVMPHNLFLHSEIIQSRQWNLKDEKVIKHQLRFEFYDTLFSMVIGWAINSAMILVAAAVFFSKKAPITALEQAQAMLGPIVGPAAAIVFAIALLCAGLASSVTAGMAGGSIFAGLYREPYDIKDSHSRMGVAISLGLATLLILFLSEPFKGLIWSQIILSLQLPFTIFMLVYLTSSKKVMGSHANSRFDQITLYAIAAVVTGLNVMLLVSFLG
ncbi:MAG: Nramp family divalent metal transporter [Spirochaetes bacterium]|nr:Nramp family divalent metal transporter [Spirochaetota bacterium]